MICYVNLLTGELIEFANAKQLIAYLVDKKLLPEQEDDYNFNS